jgi:hypothetical protein
MLIEEHKRRIVRDGERVSVPLQLMDAQQRDVAASSSLTDAEKRRARAYADYDTLLAERWKGPATADASAEVSSAVVNAHASTATGSEAYREYDRKLAERWRHAT